MKALVDLNVFLDVEQQRQPHFPDSSAVISTALNKAFEAWMPAHSLTTLYYLTERYAGSAAADIAVDWHLRHFRIPSLTEAVFRSARTLGFQDFEDAVVAASALSAGCQWIVTRNTTDFTLSPVPAITPTNFLKIVRNSSSRANLIP